jgi:hypothetical protein
VGAIVGGLAGVLVGVIVGGLVRNSEAVGEPSCRWYVGAHTVIALSL